MADCHYLYYMIIALILILFAVALFLIFHDDHDDSYTRRERNARRDTAPKSFYEKAETRRPAPRTVVPKEKEYRPGGQDPGIPTFLCNGDEKVLDFHFPSVCRSPSRNCARSMPRKESQGSSPARAEDRAYFSVLRTLVCLGRQSYQDFRYLCSN